MILYHLSTNIVHDGNFEPRIPQCRCVEENSDIARVCVATSLEGCFSAIPDGGMRLDELNMRTRGYYLIFKIDTEKLHIKDENIISDRVLYEKDLVRDAEVTGEHWITCTFQVPKEDQIIIKVISWGEEAHDFVSHGIYQLADKEYEGDYCQAYIDIYKEPVPCITEICNLKYQNTLLQKDQSISLYYDIDEEEAVFIKDFLKQYYLSTVKVIDDGIDEIEVVALKDVDMTPIIYKHALYALRK